MARRIAVSTLNASTYDIINTIRANAPSDYQNAIPEASPEMPIPRVGEHVMGYPAFANYFLNALINRIALVKINSATFNNAYAELKKGYLQFGETVEEVFVSIAKAREFSVEKAEKREFKRTLPDVRTAFHTMNWRAQYPVTVQQEDLRMAFTSEQGMQDLIARIINSVVIAAEYDEFLLFKYLLIKAISHGKMFPVAIDASDNHNCAKAFRGYSNALEFMNTKFNFEGVTTNTKKADQYIFMDAQFNAAYDVDVLASAFNMDKATFAGKLKLIDDWTTFDNERFDEIRENSEMLEEVTADELALMANVKAVLLDKEWFQIYDNLTTMTETPVASGIYWNYFYNVWKTVSSSPFSNAIVFVDDAATVTQPDTYTIEVTSKSIGETATVITVDFDSDEENLVNNGYRFLQTEAATEDGIAIHRYGAFIFPPNKTEVALECVIGGVKFAPENPIDASNLEVGSTIILIKQE